MIVTNFAVGLLPCTLWTFPKSLILVFFHVVLNKLGRNNKIKY